jgi:hypothetical protein
MRVLPASHSKLLAAMALGCALALPSLSCSAISSLWASPTPTVTSTPTPTETPTITPSPTPSALLSAGERSGYRVILRYVGEDVHLRFLAIQEYLIQQGYTVDIDAGPSAIGSMDVIQFGALSCNQAIDDLTALLAGKLSLQGLERVRFISADASYNKQNIVIQIQSLDRFGPGG